jgi:hypothetical protein
MFEQWIITEVQFFASNDPSDGVREVSDWCEREWNRALHIDPYNVAILTGLLIPCNVGFFH